MASGDTYQSTFISSAATTTCKAGPGVLGRVILGTTAAGLITLYDGEVAAGKILGELKVSIPEGVYTFDVNFKTSLVCVTAGASHLTVTWY